MFFEKFIEYGITKRHFIKSKVKINGKEKPTVVVPKMPSDKTAERFKKNKNQASNDNNK